MATDEDREVAATCAMAIHLDDIANEDIVVDGMNHPHGHRSVSVGTDRQDITVFASREQWRTIHARIGMLLDDLDTEAGDA